MSSAPTAGRVDGDRIEVDAEVGQTQLLERLGDGRVPAAEVEHHAGCDTGRLDQAHGGAVRRVGLVGVVVADHSSPRV
jgi:hypothetical protein